MAPARTYAWAAEVTHTGHCEAVHPASSLCFPEKHTKALAYISLAPSTPDQPYALSRGLSHCDHAISVAVMS